MHRVLQRLWNDDGGAIISTEWLIVVVVLLFGLIPGFVAVRNGTDASYGTVANLLLGLLPSFTFSGFAIGKQEGTGTPSTAGAHAKVGGYVFSTNFDSNPPDDGDPFNSPPNPFIWAVDTNSGAPNWPVEINSLITVDPAP